jgi:nucleoside-diphosphate-sugar epimerase
MTSAISACSAVRSAGPSASSWHTVIRGERHRYPADSGTPAVPTSTVRPSPPRGILVLVSPRHPAGPRTDAELDELLSRPTPDDVAAAAALNGDLLILGAGGKMGPSLARLARRASDEAGGRRRVGAVSRFRTPGVARDLSVHGVETMPCDLLDARALADLPDAPNVVLIAGQKFGTTGDPATTWALNAYLPAAVVRRFPAARVVVFSTGNVYPLVPVTGGGATENDPVEPVGEYAQSALARERLVTFFAVRQQAPAAILRLNYAVELRYGVLRDLADRVASRQPVDLTMGWVNVIWQRDANSVALRALAACAVPPLVLNVTGSEKLSVRDLATRLGQRLGVSPVFVGREAETALLSDASRCRAVFGSPTVDAATALDWVADWVRRGGSSLGKPTHFDERGGRF